jgi:hypothetical protein
MAPYVELRPPWERDMYSQEAVFYMLHGEPLDGRLVSARRDTKVWWGLCMLSVGLRCCVRLSAAAVWSFNQRAAGLQRVGTQFAAAWPCNQLQSPSPSLGGTPHPLDATCILHIFCTTGGSATFTQQHSSRLVLYCSTACVAGDAVCTTSQCTGQSKCGVALHTTQVAPLRHNV